MTAPNLHVRPVLAGAPPPSLAQVVVQGLQQTPKRLPPWLLYDARGAELFQQILTLPEYYLPRAEADLLATHGPLLWQQLLQRAPQWVVVEPGAGEARQVQQWLATAPSPNPVQAFVALDIAPQPSTAALQQLAQRWPQLQAHLVLGSYLELEDPVHLAQREPLPVLVFFPGSSLGNYAPPEARSLLQRFARWAGPTGLLLLGVDLLKDAESLQLAYDDPAGITRAFALNLANRLQRELQLPLSADDFDYRCLFNRNLGRMELHLVARHPLHFSLLGQPLRFIRGENLHIEDSWKYTPESTAHLLASAGWHSLVQVTDPQQRFLYALARPA